MNVTGTNGGVIENMWMSKMERDVHMIYSVLRV